jgi:hypothetical protein
MDTLIISDKFRNILNEILFVVFVIELAKISVHSIEFFLERYLKTHNKAKKAAYYAMVNISRILV